MLEHASTMNTKMYDISSNYDEQNESVVFLE